MSTHLTGTVESRVLERPCLCRCRCSRVALLAASPGAPAALRDGGTLSISVYDDQAGADESSRVAASWMRDNMPEVTVDAPAISGGEVVISA